MAELTHTAWDPEVYQSAVEGGFGLIVSMCGRRVAIGTVDLDNPTCLVCDFGLRRLKELKAEVEKYREALYEDGVETEWKARKEDDAGGDGYPELFSHLADK